MGNHRFIQGLIMWHFIKFWFNEYIECMKNAHLLDESYMELDMDREFGRGEY